MVWRAHQPPAALFMEAMERAGLRARLHRATFAAEMPKERWFAMVRSRFWSTFSKFSDAELEAGIVELEASHAGVDCVTFREELLLLVGEKQ